MVENVCPYDEEKISDNCLAQKGIKTEVDDSLRFNGDSILTDPTPGGDSAVSSTNLCLFFKSFCVIQPYY